MSQAFTLTRNKDPYERWFAEIDAARFIGTETIANVDFTAQTEAGVDASTTFLDPAKCTFTGSKIKPYIRGGTDGERYIVVMKVRTATDPSYDVYTLTVNVQNIV